MSFFITGGEGQLGHELKKVLWRRGIHFFAPSRQTLDITSKEQVERALEIFLSYPHPQGVIHCAAFTDVDGCEREIEKAYMTNTYGSTLLALKAAESHLPFVFISTDYVFDGWKREPYREEDIPNPMNIYGRSKLKGERAILSFHPQSFIMRTSWLFGLYGHNYIEAVLKKAEEGEPLNIIDDEVGLPTYAKDLAMMIIDLLNTEAPSGIYHLANRGAVSRYALAREALDLMGYPTVIEKIPSSGLNRLAVRPTYSVLDLNKAEKYIEIRDYREGLREYVEELKKRKRKENIS